MDSMTIEAEPLGSESVYRVCRLCMSEECLEDIFQEVGLSQWISDLLSIKVSPEDRLSKVVCPVCRMRLAEFHRYRVRCLEVQEVLQSMVLDEDVDEEMELEVQEVHPPGEGGGPSNLNLFGICEGQEPTTSAVTEQTSDEQGEVKPGLSEVDDCTTGTGTLDEAVELNSWPEASLVVENRHPSSVAADLPLDIAQSNEEDDCTLVEGEDAEGDPSIEMEDTSNTDKGAKACLVCNKKFSTQKLLTLHHYYTHVTTIKCPSCDLNFATQKRLEVHIKASHQQGVKPGLDEADDCTTGTGARDEVVDLDSWPEASLVGENSNPSSVAQEEEEDDCTVVDCEDAEDDSSIEMEDMSNTDEGAEACQVCNKKFSNLQLLTQHHYYTHAMTFKCSLCDSKFTTQKRLELHIKVSHQEGEDKQEKHHPFKCKLCDKTFKTVQQLGAHNRNYHAPKRTQRKYDCTLCDRKLNSLNSLKYHLGVHERNSKKAKEQSELFKCTQCDKEFRSLSGLKYHFENVKHVKQEQCLLCSSSFMTRHQLERHVSAHHTPNKIQCPLCDVSVSNHRDLRKHRLREHRAQLVRRKLDRKRVEQGKQKDETTENIKSELDSGHSSTRSLVIEQQQPDLDVVHCVQCDRIFKSPAGLEWHNKVSHAEKTHKCTLCTQSYSLPELLEKHMVTVHMQADGSYKPLTCEDCNEVFQSLPVYRAHMRQHVQNKTRRSILGLD